MKFIKENSYDIVRLIINQVGITIFSLVLYTAVGMVDMEQHTKLIVNVVLSIFSTLFYFSLLYTFAWEWGAKDKIRIDSGKVTRDLFKGAKIALLANTHNFLLAFLCSLFFAMYLLGFSPAFYNTSLIFNTIVRLIMSMYLGILQGIFVSLRENTDIYYFLQSVGYFVLPFLAVAVTHLGYFMGLKEKKIFGSNLKKS